MIESKEAGWKVLKKEVIGELHLMTIEMTTIEPVEYNKNLHNELHDNLIEHSHRSSITTDFFVFDHEPTNEDIENALEEYGFSPFFEDVDRDVIVMYGAGNLELDGQTLKRKNAPIITNTDGEDDVLEFNKQIHPNEFKKLYDMLPIAVDEMPSSMSLKGDWLYMYYVNAESRPPEQFEFEENFFIYSVRVHKDTGEIRRKGYNKVDSLPKEITSSLQDYENTICGPIVAVGIFLDEPRITVYYMKSFDLEDRVENVTTVEIPYYGTTWENETILRTRMYKRDGS